MFFFFFYFFFFFLTSPVKLRACSHSGSPGTRPSPDCPAGEARATQRMTRNQDITILYIPVLWGRGRSRGQFASLVMRLLPFKERIRNRGLESGAELVLTDISHACVEKVIPRISGVQRCLQQQQRLYLRSLI